MLERCMGMCLQMADEVAERAMVNQMLIQSVLRRAGRLTWLPVTNAASRLCFKPPLISQNASGTCQLALIELAVSRALLCSRTVFIMS